MIYQPMSIPSRAGGGALPTYQRKVDNHAPGSGVTARVDDSAARIIGAGADTEARALDGLGKGIKGAVDVGIKAYDDYSKSKATQLITAYRRTMDEALYGDGGILTQQGEAGIHADQQRADRARQLRGDLLKDTNDFTQHYFSLLADDYDADTSLKAQKYAGAQQITMLNRNDEAAAQERADFAMSRYAEQQDFDKGLGEGLWHAEQRLRRQGYSGEALARGLKEFSSKVFAGGIQQALARNDLRSAERLLAEGSKVHGEGDSAWSRMTVADAAEARTRMQTRRDALQAKAEADRERAEKERERASIQNSVNAILTDVSEFGTLEEQNEAAFARADAIEDPAVREKVRTEIKQEMSWRSTRYDATVARQKRQFHDLARNQGWTPRQAADQLDKAEGLSERAREELRKDFDGRAERQTPANKAALAELRTLLDRGPERSGIDPKDADAIDAYIYRHGLTYEQGRDAHQYAEQGGMAGEVTQTQINRVFKVLFPELNAKDAPGDLFDLVGEELKRVAPGKAATDAEVKSVMARLYAEGETEGAGWFTWGVGKDETRMEALRQGRGKNWSPDGEVPAEDAARIETLLRESGVEPTPGRVRRYYWEEQGGKA